jgi:hypothetical protein
MPAADVDAVADDFSSQFRSFISGLRRSAGVIGLMMPSMRLNCYWRAV